MEVVSEGKLKHDNGGSFVGDLLLRSRKQISPQRAETLVLCEQIKLLRKASKYAASLQSPPSAKGPLALHSLQRPVHIKTKSLNESFSGPSPFLGVGFPSPGSFPILRPGNLSRTKREMLSPVTGGQESPDCVKDLSKSFATLPSQDEMERPLFRSSFMRNNTPKYTRVQLGRPLALLPQLKKSGSALPTDWAAGLRSLSRIRPKKTKKTQVSRSRRVSEWQVKVGGATATDGNERPMGSACGGQAMSVDSVPMNRSLFLAKKVSRFFSIRQLQSLELPKNDECLIPDLGCNNLIYDMFTPGQVLFGQYRITKKLGAGGFAEVYKAKSLLDSKGIAVKVEKDGRFEWQTLDHEAVILAKLEGVEGVPKVLFLKKSGGKTLLGLNDLGYDLYSMRKAGQLLITHENLVLIAWKLLLIIEEVHSRGILHMDIKPDNILLSKGKTGKMHLIDFGISREWRGSGGHNFMGSALFCSARRMENRPPARKDDLESWLYTIAFLATLHLPWELRAMARASGWKSSIAEAKRTIDAQEFCIALPREFCEIMTCVRSIKPLDRPNYELLKSLLTEAADRLGVDLNSRVQLGKEDEISSPPVFSLSKPVSRKSREATMRANSAFHYLARARTITPSETLKPAEDIVEMETPKDVQYTPKVTAGLRSHLTAAKLRNRRVSAYE